MAMATKAQVWRMSAILRAPASPASHELRDAAPANAQTTQTAKKAQNTQAFRPHSKRPARVSRHACVDQDAIHAADGDQKIQAAAHDR
ncbi:hypothetical protein [Leptothrix discophora]|uniref:Uncharacterized protein n=1 Tax=Leptothrix discophora TaxID=89 RepID=A0ABT9G0N1_LEPDI|nr:hypothetical protein [Leptothrix discophora]MDP4300043.1 hypothetical protein [Leptothrix discophora]